MTTSAAGRRCFLSALFVAVGIIVALPANATHIVVRPDGTGDLPTLQAGIDCLMGVTCNPSPDTLVVEAGVYSEDVFFDLTSAAPRAQVLCPAGPSATRVRSIGSGGGFNTKVTVEGLQVDGRVVSDESGSPLRWIRCRFMGDALSHSHVGSQLFNDCEFRARLDVAGSGGLARCRFIGARAALQLTVFGLTIQDCVFQDCADTAVVATPGDASMLSFERCTFRTVDRAIVVNPNPNYHRDGLRVVDSRFEDVRYEAISFDSRSTWPLCWLQFVVLRSSFTRCGAGVRVTGSGRIDLTMVADTLDDTRGPSIHADAALNYALDSLVVRRSAAAAIVLREKSGQEPLFRSLTRSRIEDNLGDGLTIEAAPESAFVHRWIAQNVLARNQGAGVRAGDGVSLIENLAVANGGDGFHLSPRAATADSVVLNTAFDNGGAGIRVSAATGSEPRMFVDNNLAVENDGAGIALIGSLMGTAVRNDAWTNHGGDFQGVDMAANLSENPLFCSTANLDFHVAENSPCAPSGPHGAIGALGVGCPQVVAVVPSSQGELAIGRVAPNPLVGGHDVTVSFTLPSAAAASMEVLDATGRRLSSRDLGTSTPGDHRLQLRMEKLPPGIYWVRVAQAGRAAASKLSVLP